MNTSPLSSSLGSTLGSRAWRRLEALRRFTDTPNAITRLYLSKSHRASVEAVLAMMREAGCDTVHVDALGSVIGRYEGNRPDLPALLIGSHIDTVVDGGAYDGALGVIAGIGVVEALRDRGERLDFAVEVLAFGDEENVRFTSNLTSSRALAGTLDAAGLEAVDESGVTIRQALIEFGCNPSGWAALKRDPASVLGYVEMHIEQGPVLEAEGLAVGVVSAINGASRWTLTVTGEAGHAGTVPMKLRHDALTAAAEMVLAIEKLGARHADTVATVGRLHVEPGAVNVIAGKVRFTLDARSPDDNLRARLVEEIAATCNGVASKRGVDLTIDRFFESAATPMAQSFITGLSDAIAGRQIAPRVLPSGAGHDAMAMAALCPVGMLFVRCKGGVSHSPLEAMTEADADLAIAVLLDFVRAFKG